ncbi:MULTISPECIES: sensor histidine kinase [Aneurinibacillus]|uniref:histidine kinase n=1 Tax=Aneurinibacillus thermoaerophilus TaxID=143495 RepID=A0ABX8YBK3_ANETH|nr:MULTISPECIES: HAMP domain-containing sensor histidine kinase [Aneurinibacillus]AMA74347.1 hypothetical protein ACH33_17035 [Aneurinibacillus sp. XH2]MED0678752.1 HAMP domain-containing sensor histidine kinase [Aneurinibacillus thermoaerophilus]MED0736742.1 HAMP domain-containing sensor histidine kinase [Aneurinibacillus thermoaerophilus]MED0766104.1 HAMP domain-containing sensor histidine kinase [Aneurinibacillus thermoaerophilus]QYY43073.1 HAMP domain-containing histidine kinase [Aneurinib
MKWKMTSLFLVPLILMTVAFTFINLAAVIYFSSAEPEKNAFISFFPYEEYTRKFGRFIVFVDDKPQVSPEGKKELSKKRAWIQILNANGTEVYNLNKPEAAPKHYTPGELVHYYRYTASIQDSTLFVSWVTHEDTKWTYILGFHYHTISRYVMSFSPFKMINFWKEVILAVFVLTFLMVITIGYFFGRKLTRPLVEIIGSIQALAQGHYSIKYNIRGLYKDVYKSLNQLADALKASEVQRMRLEKMRDEWVTNLSHDLKTPLASIKGFGEVLADSDYEISPDERRKYADIIVGKTSYMEKLLEDLRLTYQLKNNLLPLQKKEENVVELVREIIIDLLNDPQYGDRAIEFVTNKEHVPLLLDRAYFTRAFTNLIYNAVIHNLPDTRVCVTVTEEAEMVTVLIRDSGKGIAEEEIDKLFTRYYRGTSTNERHQGSGLGMAIAKQIIDAHGGEICVTSKLGEGTAIRVVFLRQKDKKL